MACRVKLSTGESYKLEDWAEKVQKTINDARGQGKLIEVGLCSMPYGQRAWIDPDAVVSIVPDNARTW